MQDLFFYDKDDLPQRLCKKCGKCCKNNNCKYLSEDNLCSVYANRPELCKSFPSSPWEKIPDGCGYEGWLFQKREEIKQQIRKKKEDLLILENELKSANCEQVAKLNENIEKTNKFIENYIEFGSKDW